MQPLLVPCFHLGLFFLVYKLLFLSRIITVIDPFFLNRWDAQYYASIAEHGYQFTATKGGNTAFFPLFPYIWKTLWKLVGAGVEGVCLYNIIAFLLGMVILKKTYNFSWSYFLLFVSIPSNVFMYVPYSEATFFFFSSILLAGLKKENKSMVFAGLFFASLTRPSALFFIPAIIVMELIAFDTIKIFIKNVFTYSGMSICAILLVFVFQFYTTGVWLAFFRDGWSRSVNLPQFPLTTWDGFKNLWLDGLALFFAFLAALILLILLFLKLKRKDYPQPGKAEVFSMTYAVMALLTLLTFGGIDGDGGTSLLSLNRFLMATPFFTIMLFFLSHQVKLNFRSFIIYVGVALLAFLVLNLQGTGYLGYTENDKRWYVLIMFGFFMLLLTMSQKFKGKYIAMLYLINIVLQIILLNRFVYAGWVG